MGDATGSVKFISWPLSEDFDLEIKKLLAPKQVPRLDQRICSGLLEPISHLIILKEILLGVSSRSGSISAFSVENCQLLWSLKSASQARRGTIVGFQHWKDQKFLIAFSEDCTIDVLEVESELKGGKWISSFDLPFTPSFIKPVGESMIATAPAGPGELHLLTLPPPPTLASVFKSKGEKTKLGNLLPFEYKDCVSIGQSIWTCSSRSMLKEFCMTRGTKALSTLVLPHAAQLKRSWALGEQEILLSDSTGALFLISLNEEEGSSKLKQRIPLQVNGAVCDCQSLMGIAGGTADLLAVVTLDGFLCLAGRSEAGAKFEFLAKMPVPRASSVAVLGCVLNDSLWADLEQQ